MKNVLQVVDVVEEIQEDGNYPFALRGIQFDALLLNLGISYELYLLFIG